MPWQAVLKFHLCHVTEYITLQNRNGEVLRVFTSHQCCHEARFPKAPGIFRAYSKISNLVIAD